MKIKISEIRRMVKEAVSEQLQEQTEKLVEQEEKHEVDMFGKLIISLVEVDDLFSELAEATSEEKGKELKELKKQLRDLTRKVIYLKNKKEDVKKNIEEYNEPFEQYAYGDDSEKE